MSTDLRTDSVSTSQTNKMKNGAITLGAGVAGGTVAKLTSDAIFFRKLSPYVSDAKGRLIAETIVENGQKRIASNEEVRQLVKNAKNQHVPLQGKTTTFASVSELGDWYSGYLGMPRDEYISKIMSNTHEARKNIIYKGIDAKNKAITENVQLAKKSLASAEKRLPQAELMQKIKDLKGFKKASSILSFVTGGLIAFIVADSLLKANES